MSRGLWHTKHLILDKRHASIWLAWLLWYELRIIFDFGLVIVGNEFQKVLSFDSWCYCVLLWVYYYVLGKVLLYGRREHLHCFSGLSITMEKWGHFFIFLYRAVKIYLSLSLWSKLCKILLFLFILTYIYCLIEVIITVHYFTQHYFHAYSCLMPIILVDD